MTEREKEIFQRAVGLWGESAQTLMLFEEMAELQKAILKYWRGKGEFLNFFEEIADVRIMLDQLELMWGCSADVQYEREKKIKRLEKLVKGES